MSDAANRWTTRRISIVVSLVAGVSAVGASLTVVGLTQSFVASAVADAVTNTAPDAVVAGAIQTLGNLGQALVLAVALCLTVGLFACCAFVGLAVGRRAQILGGRVVVTTLLASALGLVLTGALGSALAAGLGAGLVVGVAGGDTGRSMPAFHARRRALKAGASAAVAVGLGALVGSGRQRGGGPTADAGPIDDPQVRALLDEASRRSFSLADTDTLLTETEAFYTVDISAADPAVAAEDWSLRLTGAGVRSRRLTMGQLESLPAEHRFVTLRCVGDPLNGEKIDTALWTGVPMETVLEDLAPPEACCVRVRAADDYYQVFPLSALERGFLAYRMNGRPLPTGHGHPVRLLVPGHWGEINVKWLDEIEFLTRDAEGYWEKRGWNGTGPVNTVAKLHSVETVDDGRVRVGGHAYAGTRGIERVEVSTDGGETWEEASLSTPLPASVAAEVQAGGAASNSTGNRTNSAGNRSNATESDDPSQSSGFGFSGSAEDAWRMWRYEYEATDQHEVVVRAVDGTGTVQPETEASAYPSGASGWVRERVRP
ncbi:hypothetical protein AUR64_15890 [Haloprofundus marisrubri]|uniref:Sulfite oxidase n=1 Tax=Haloprofundus marisrubri TaxID=1514971 RepID=A0A0W1R771_9EURY|nr:molybdopterin-dependent oxidoreductase [Haloprofundus marisrubri]KTG09267.1 hypothetical protein AUR64_15890 [Haloprofundus marisrubri]